jgi:hypothetical protein
MKLHLIVCLSGSLLLAASLVSAQGKTLTEASLDQDPFSKGSVFVGPMSWMGGSLITTMSDGFTQSKETKYGIGIYPIYFPINHLGFGINLGDHYKDTKFSDGGSENKDSRFSVGADLLYGMHFTHTFNLDFRGGVNFGQENMTTISGTDKSTYKYNLLDYGFSIGAPLHLCSEGHLYFGPYVSYHIFNSSTTGQKTVDNRFGVGFNLETYILREDRGCSNVHQATTNMYQRGYSYIDFSTAGKFSLETDKSTSNYGGTFPTENITKWSFCGGYNYYFINYLSGGIRAGIGDESDKFNTDESSTGMFKWSVGPFIDFHVPVDNWANKFYVYGGYDWASIKSTSGSGIYQTSTTQMRTSFRAGAGYDWFFSTQMSVGPEFGYRKTNNKTTGSTLQIKDDGFYADFGLKYYFLH